MDCCGGRPSGWVFPGSGAGVTEWMKEPMELTVERMAAAATVIEAAEVMVNIRAQTETFVTDFEKMMTAYIWLDESMAELRKLTDD